MAVYPVADVVAARVAAQELVADAHPVVVAAEQVYWSGCSALCWALKERAAVRPPMHAVLYFPEHGLGLCAVRPCDSPVLVRSVAVHAETLRDAVDKRCAPSSMYNADFRSSSNRSRHKSTNNRCRKDTAPMDPTTMDNNPNTMERSRLHTKDNKCTVRRANTRR